MLVIVILEDVVRRLSIYASFGKLGMKGPIMTLLVKRNASAEGPGLIGVI